MLLCSDFFCLRVFFIRRRTLDVSAFFTNLNTDGFAGTMGAAQFNFTGFCSPQYDFFWRAIFLRGAVMLLQILQEFLFLFFQNSVIHAGNSNAGILELAQQTIWCDTDFFSKLLH